MRELLIRHFQSQPITDTSGKRGNHPGDIGGCDSLYV
jgi:hypothetical protein